MAPLKKKQEDFRKSRKFQTMKKKLEELTTLCDVDAFLLCFEHGNSDDIPSYSWPEDQRNCFSLIHEYRRSLAEEQNKNKNKRKRSSDSSSASSFKKMKMMFDIDRKHRGFQMGDFRCFEGFGSDEVGGVLDRIDRNRMAVKERIQFLKLNQSLKPEEKPYEMYEISNEQHQEKESDMTMMMMSSGLLESIILQSGALVDTSGNLREAQEATGESAQVADFSEMEFLGYGGSDDHQGSFDFGISLEDLDFFNF